MAYLNVIDWHVTPFRADRWFDTWRPAAERSLAFGASSWSLTRSADDPLHFRQETVWDDKVDFDRYWYSAELTAIREEAVNLYHKPVLPTWHEVVAQS